jgi:hypothetical protein
MMNQSAADEFSRLVKEAADMGASGRWAAVNARIEAPRRASGPGQ